jgi:death-on-curing family protein
MKILDRVTVAKLAELANRETEDALLSLWDAGLNSILDVTDVLTGEKLEQAKRVLALPTNRQIGSLPYWQKVFSLNESELRILLVTLGISMSPKARRLPRGATKILRAEARRRRSPSMRPIIEVPINTDLICQQEKEPIISNFIWKIVGHERDVRRLTVEETLAIHDALVTDFRTGDDPIEPPGPRSATIIESAVFRQYTSIGDSLKYPTPEMNAAALLHSLVLDHPFHNGNKRTALVSMLVVLDENNVMMVCDEDELFKLVLSAAQHRIIDCKMDFLADREVMFIADWIINNSRTVEHGEKPLAFRVLRSILNGYKCNIVTAPSGMLKISRSIGKTMFGKPKDVVASFQYGGDGREVTAPRIKKLRAELYLDDEHGIDSAAFYKGGTISTDEFLVKYRKTLRRLARL